MLTKERMNELASEFAEKNGNTEAVNAFLSYIEETEGFPKNPGRKVVMTKKKIAEILRTADQNEGTLDIDAYSRNYLERLVLQGYMEKHTVENGKRGRNPVQYVMTGKGRGFLALSKNWKL